MTECISIIVAIYKVEPYLRQCIESILNQTFQNLEIILVDDGSPDGCPAICEEYALRDGRIRVIHKENGGSDSARKAGILASTGTYISYVDGDDWIELNMYETLYELAQKWKASIVESGVIDSYEDQERYRVSYFQEGFYTGKQFSDYILPKLIYTGTFFQHGISPYLVNKLFRKEVIIDFQLLDEPSKNLVDDVMCVFPSIVAAKSLYITHGCFYHYRVRINSTKRLTREDIVPTIQLCYPDWKNRFEQSENMESIEKQIQYLTMYLLIAKAPYAFDDPNSNLCLMPYGGIEKNAEIILYGAGTAGIQLRNYLMKNPRCQVVYWADCNYKQFGDKLSVGDPSEIPKKKFDYVIVAILNATAAASAMQDLIRMGVRRDKIRWIADEYITEPLEVLNMVISDK